MKKKVLISVGVVVILVLAGFGFMVWKNSKTPPIAADCGTGIGTIYYTPQKAFLPSCVKVAAGSTITYTNQSTDLLDVAVNPHPIHNGNKEVSGGKFVLEVKPGESQQVALHAKGTFGIHDHKNASSVAVIVVE